MFPVQYPQKINSISLGDLNPEAFKNMSRSGHRVVSIVKEALSKFKVNTECVGGVKDCENKLCQGFMQIEITQTGTKLYLGSFKHHRNCQDKYKFQTITIDGIEMKRDDFNEFWPAIIEEAKAGARLKQIKAIHDKEGAVYSRGDRGTLESLRSKVKEAQTISYCINSLEDQFKAFFKERSHF